MYNKMEIDQVIDLLTNPEGSSLQQALAAQETRTERFRSKDARREAETLLAELLDPSRVKQLTNIQANERAKLESAANELEAKAIENSHEAQEVLNAAAAQAVGPFGGVIDPTPEGPQYELLNKPFLLWNENFELESSEIVPSNSWAKFTMRQGGEEYSAGGATFHYLWSNPKDSWAVINVNGYASFNGYCHAIASGGLFGGGNSANVKVRGGVILMPLWNSPPTALSTQPSQVAIVAEADANAGGFGFELHPIDVSVGCDVSYTLLPVPPFGSLVIVVKAGVICATTEHGNVLVDFASEGFQVGSTGVLVTVLP